MKIEKITTSEIPLITRLYALCFKKPMDENDLQNLLSKPSTHGFRIENKAFLLTQQVGDETEIIDIAVSPDARGYGLATALIEHLKQQTLSVFLEVNATNTPALSLYKKMGFKQISVRKQYYDNKDDALVMKL